MILAASCCAQHAGSRCVKPPVCDPLTADCTSDPGPPLFALPVSCREPGCGGAVAEAFSRCERKIYDAQMGGEGLGVFQELLGSCQGGGH